MPSGDAYEHRYAHLRDPLTPTACRLILVDSSPRLRRCTIQVTNAKAYRPMTVFKEVLAVYTDFLAKLPKPLPVGVSKRLGVSRAADKKYGTDYMANINEFLERVVDSPERLLTP